MISHLLMFWTEMLTHLWQTTLVLVPLLLLDRMMRGAPGAVRHSLWTLALAKFLLPFSLLGRPIHAALGSLIPGKGTLTVPGELPTLAAISAVVDPARGFGLGDRIAGVLPAWVLIGLSVLWGSVALLALAKLAWEVCDLCRRRGEPLSVLRDDERIRLESLLTRAHVPHEAVRLTTQEVVPSVVGLVRPCVVIPARLVGTMTANDLHAILLHERAHGIRRDPFRAVIQRICLALFFFFPPTWLVIRKLRETAEFACDESVVQAGIPPADYGQALSRVFALALEPMARCAAGVEGDGTLLHRRLANLRSPSLCRYRPAYRCLVLCGALIVAAGLIVPLPTLAVGDGRDSVTPPPHVPLDRVPTLISHANPVYPERARKAGVEGTVHLNLRIDETGVVDSVVVARGVDGHLEFASAALDAARQWLFTPGEWEGRPVTAWVTVPVAFSLEASVDAGSDRPLPTPRTPTAAAQAPSRHSTQLAGGVNESHLPILDTVPVLTKQALPAYPDRAREDGAEGTVVLDVHVSAAGIVDSVFASTGVEGYPEFAATALHAAREWRFTPGMRDGQAVAAWVRCPVKFQLDGHPSEKPQGPGISRENA